MPRKKPPQAEVQADKAGAARWRYLLRHPDFRADLALLRRAGSEPVTFGGVTAQDPGFIRRRMIERWGLNSIPAEIIGYPYSVAALPDFTLETISLYEALSWRDEAMIFDPAIWDATVECREDPRKVLILGFNLSHPTDVLVSLAERAIRRAKGSGPLGPPRRQRLDKVDFYLEVYDRAEEGKKFGSIAKGLKRRVSTVKSAYLAASRNIFGPGKGPSKKSVPLASFHAEGHCQVCPICRKAQTPEELCPKALLYANQDTKAQREMTGHDTVLR